MLSRSKLSMISNGSKHSHCTVHIPDALGENKDETSKLVRSEYSLIHSICGSSHIYHIYTHTISMHIISLRFESQLRSSRPLYSRIQKKKKKKKTDTQAGIPSVFVVYIHTNSQIFFESFVIFYVRTAQLDVSYLVRYFSQLLYAWASHSPVSFHLFSYNDVYKHTF